MATLSPNGTACPSQFGFEGLVIYLGDGVVWVLCCASDAATATSEGDTWSLT